MIAIAAATGATAIFEPELVQLYEPPTPTATARTGCPHTTGALLDWHNAATWNGAGVPSTAGADVTLPSSSRVLLSRSAAGLAQLLTALVYLAKEVRMVLYFVSAGGHGGMITIMIAGAALIVIGKFINAVALFMIWKRVNSGEIVLVQVDGRKSMIEAVDPPQP